MNLNIRLFWINLRLWKALGFIQPANFKKAILILFMSILTNIAQYVHLYNVIGKLEDFVFSFFLTTSLSLSMLRVLHIMKNEDKLLDLLADVDYYYNLTKVSNNKDKSKIFNDVEKRCRAYVKFTFTYLFLGVFALSIKPIITNTRQFGFEVDVPGIDIHQSPYFEIIVAIQIFVVVNSVAVTYVPYTTFFPTFLMAGTGLLEDLFCQLVSLYDKSGKELEDGLKSCIKYHIRIISFRDKFQALFSNMTLLEVLLNSIMLCMILFFFASSQSSLEKIVASFFCIIVSYSIFIKNWRAVQFSHAGFKIAEAVYGVDWVNDNKKVRTYVLIMIARSQKPLEITAGGIYPLTMDTFRRLINASYTYFTLLQGTQ